jgi:hypothetical protein
MDYLLDRLKVLLDMGGVVRVPDVGSPGPAPPRTSAAG